MAWSEEYPSGKEPTLVQISSYINNPLWNELCGFIEERYKAAPKIEYSRCSGAPGWNVKYKKGGKSVCTLYPNSGYFTCLVVIADSKQIEAELILSGCDESIQNLYTATKSVGAGSWLMIDVTSNKILNDTKQLICLRAG